MTGKITPNQSSSVTGRGHVTQIAILELMLILASVALVGQLCWPGVARWWRRPGAGSLGVDRWEHVASTEQVPVRLAHEYLLYLPDGYSDRRRPWPLVVFLHGAGERGQDTGRLKYGPFDAILSGIKIPAIVAAPQCLEYCDWDPETISGFIRDVESKYSADSTRVYVVGYSMGAYGAWRAAAMFPDLFAAIVPISGGGDLATVHALESTPIWAFHGEDDQVIPLSASREMVDAVNADGGHAKLTVIPHAGHGICNVVCTRTDLWEWLFQQNRNFGHSDGRQESASR